VERAADGAEAEHAYPYDTTARRLLRCRVRGRRGH
jgi:hypothetical protein